MKYKLEEVCNQIYSGGTPSTSHKEYWNGDLPWMSSGETSQRFVYTTEKFITEEGVRKSSTKFAKKASTVMASAGQGHTRGQVSFLMNDMYVNQSVLVFDPNEAIVNPLYLYYNLDGRYEELRQLSDGTSTRGSLSGRIVKGMEIELPELEVQNKVVDILYSIDKKMEINIQINRNLLEQAQAYFNELFIVKALLEWEEGTLSDVGTIVAGGTPSKAQEEYYTEKGIAWITPKDLSVDKSVFISHGECDITELGLQKSSATMMPAGTVLFSSRAPIGYIAIAANEVSTNQGFKSVVPNKNVGTAYIYFLLKQLLPTIENMASGSTFKEISGAAMKIVPTIIPDDETLKKFADFSNPIMMQIQNNELETKRLIELRDSLLPKLMSGELDVSNITI